MSKLFRVSRTKTLWCMLAVGLFLWCADSSSDRVSAQPSRANPLIVAPDALEVRVFGKIFPTRFNATQGEEARYHLLVWEGGSSVNALIETPADDLDFHDALIQLGVQPGDNLTMAAWTERHNADSPAPRMKVTGNPLDVRITWAGHATSLPLNQIFRRSAIRDPQSPIEWRFGGNRERWFNRVPFAPRPGCLACLYSCPSGKVSNGVLTIHDYVTLPSRFIADTNLLPPDRTPVIVTFRALTE